MSRRTSPPRQPESAVPDVLALNWNRGGNVGIGTMASGLKLDVRSAGLLAGKRSFLDAASPLFHEIVIADRAHVILPHHKELDRLRDLFQSNYEPKQIIFLRDLYGLLEKVIDGCRDAGNIILQVALKYS